MKIAVIMKGFGIIKKAIRRVLSDQWIKQG